MKDQERNALIEVLDKMIREERRGGRFFADAAKMVRSPDARRLFEVLARDEMEHEEVLLGLRERIVPPGYASGKQAGGRKVTVGDSVQFEERAIPVFTVEEEDLLPIEPEELVLFHAEEFQELLEDASLDRILRLAMRIEYDNFKYLVDLARQMTSRDAQKKTLALAEDEKQHFVRLRKMHERLVQK